MTRRIYLDHAATTPLLPAARAAMERGWEEWANPSSQHAPGRAARAALEEARRRIARALGWDGTIVFTSGASEAIDIAFARTKAGGAIVSATEHPAVLRAARGAATLPVDETGIVRLPVLERLLVAAERPLVAIQAVNNETGVIQPLAEVAERVAAAGGLLLADCAQSAGKLPLPDADYIAVAAHKIGGPPGVGALLVRDAATLEAVGGQESGHRPGTSPVPLILGFAAALEANHDWVEGAPALRARLDRGVEAAGGELVAAAAPRAPAIGAYRLPGMPAAAQLMRLDLAGIAVSAGSACSSGSLKASHVLAAMGWSEDAAREVIRVSFGPGTTDTDVDAFLAEWRAMAERRRAA